MTGHTPSAEGEGEQTKGPSGIEPQTGRAECEYRTSRRRRRRNTFRRLKLAAGGELVMRFHDEEAGEGSSQLPSEGGPSSSAEPHPETQPSDGSPAVDVEDRPEESMEAGKPHEGPSGSGSGPPLVSHGVVSLIGRRREMEDAVAMVPGLPLASSAEVHDFFAVYDGHGGPRVAEACRERLHVVLMEEVEARGGWPRPEAANVGEEERRWWSEAMVASFARVDAEVSQWGLNQQGRTEGSTAVVAVIGPCRIVVANCGDSRAVLSRAGSALPLSTDHKPDRPDELERIEAAGGRVIEWDGCRVLGVLATSRSIGDCNLKPFVSAEPELAIMKRTQEDEFLVLASDGLWDVVSNEVACRVIRVCLTGRLAKRHPEMFIGRTAVEAATLLAKLALARGSRDNISVIVVVLKSLG